LIFDEVPAIWWILTIAFCDNIRLVIEMIMPIEAYTLLCAFGSTVLSLDTHSIHI